MNVVGRVGSLISQGVYSVATPFHPFGGAVDIIVVQQEDGSFRSTPWYVRFGKFQGVLKGAEKIVKIHVNGEEATFHMYLENTGEAFFLKDDPSNLAENVGGEEEEAEEGSSLGNDNNHEVSIEKMTICVTKECAAASELQGAESDSEQRFYELKEDPSSPSSSAYGSSRFDNLEDIIESQPSNPDVIVVVSGYGQILTAPISSEEEGERPCDEEDTRHAIGVEPVEARSAKEESPETLTLNDDAPPGRRWRLWPIQFRKAKSSLSDNSGGGGNASNNEELFADSESTLRGPPSGDGVGVVSPRKTYRPSSDQMSSLNLAEGRNTIAFGFSTRVLGTQQVDAHVYLWKWNTRIVISDVDGTITRSDVLGQFMPLVGRDWTQSGVARLFSAIKENGYQLLFLSARAIVQAYLTRNFLVNLKQDGKALPNGPVVISPDGLFPSLYREVIRRAPHEFKIACLEDIRALFPTDYNPFYAGFGNRDTDELSYRKMGIPKGKIFIINPKGEVAINHRVDVKSYTSLHTLVNDMFPLTSLVEQEDFNSWNFWKMPVPGMDF